MLIANCSFSIEAAPMDLSQATRHDLRTPYKVRASADVSAMSIALDTLFSAAHTLCRVLSTQKSSDAWDAYAGRTQSYILAEHCSKEPASKGRMVATSERLDEAARSGDRSFPATAVTSRVLKDLAAECINSLKSLKATPSARMTARIIGSPKISARVISSVVWFIAISL